MAPPFDIHDLDYALPESFIAQQPAPDRDGARLLTLDRASGALGDRRVSDLPDLLRPGDLLVLNDTKVLPAKFMARRKSGGRIPGLFEACGPDGQWRVMLQGSRRLRTGESLIVDTRDETPLLMQLIAPCGGGQWHVRVESPDELERILERIGSAPLPPYIRRDDATPDSNGADHVRYQTVYARHPGAIAAPTAGLHFTERLLDRLRELGVELTFVTLHVGAGTFKPISGSSLTDHVMHAEWYDLPASTAQSVERCRARKGRVVAVGTTSVRVLESAAALPMTRMPPSQLPPDQPPQCGATTDLFIYPPYRFQAVDAMVTNFHLPRSTLLALVMAFAGVDAVKRAYAHAVHHAYRFYSYGDAMFIS